MNGNDVQEYIRTGDCDTGVLCALWPFDAKLLKHLPEWQRLEFFYFVPDQGVAWVVACAAEYYTIEYAEEALWKAAAPYAPLRPEWSPLFYNST